MQPAICNGAFLGVGTAEKHGVGSQAQKFHTDFSAARSNGTYQDGARVRPMSLTTKLILKY